jgi:AcrR family transcriptional regulator
MSPLRADAQRNLTRVLDAAGEAFAEHGPDVSVDEIARRAGVGHATVFRRFPTKEALFAAVVEQRMQLVADAAEAALDQEDPEGGLRDFFEFVTGLHARDRCLGESFRLVAQVPAVLEQRRRTLDAVGRLVERAQDAGILRADIAAADIPVLLRAVAEGAAPFRAVEPELWRRYLGIVLDGLRPGAATPLPLPPPDEEQIAAAMQAVARC